MDKYSWTGHHDYDVIDDRRIGLSKLEQFLGIGIFTCAFFLRIIYAFRYRFDSDEPQHLHVAWAWAHGLMQYRDVFDNHTPLFHLLCAPLVAWFGDRPDLLIIMRLFMLPLWGASIWATYYIGRRLWGRRIGWWAAVLTTLMPTFFTCSLEFRTDDLWTLLWLLFLATLVGRRSRPVRSFCAGILMGAAFGVSMKTSLLLGSLGLASLLVALLCPKDYFRPGWGQRLATNLGVGILGCMLVPICLVMWFYSHGAFAPFYYDVIQHNMLSGLGRDAKPWLHLLFIPALIMALLLAWKFVVKQSRPNPLTLERTLMFMIVAIYIAALETLWPLVTRQDLLPILPLLIIVTCSFLDRPLPHRFSVIFSNNKILARLPTLPLAATICLAIWLTTTIPWKNNTIGDVKTWEAVLNLTKPDNYVMDLKGDLIFRRRAVHYVFEDITKARIARGLIDPQIPKHLIATRTCLIYKKLPDENKTFLKDSYISVGPVAVAGEFLKTKRAGSTQPITFNVAIPARYCIVNSSGEASGELDGIPYHGPRYLRSGRHAFYPFSNKRKFALVWAKAIEKGFSPFTAQIRIQ